MGTSELINFQTVSWLANDVQYKNINLLKCLIDNKLKTKQVARNCFNVLGKPRMNNHSTIACEVK